MKPQVIVAASLTLVSLAFEAANAGDMMMHHMHEHPMPAVDEMKPDAHGKPESSGKSGAENQSQEFTKTVDGLVVTLTLTPGAPKSKSTVQAAMIFTDAATHAPVKGEGVTVRWVMGKMWHDVAKQDLKVAENGTYLTSVTLPMAGEYTAVITRRYKGKAISLPITFQVTELGSTR